MEEFDYDEDELTPPNQQRVAARAIVLATLAYRGILELHGADPDAVAFWDKMRGWLYSLDIDHEIEPEEATVLDAPLGTLSSQQAVNASWRTEGAAVLTWALHCYDLPPHDGISDIDAICEGLGLFEPLPETALQSGQLRSAAEIEHYGSVALTVHWRLRQYGLKPEAMNFVEFVRGAQWGPLTVAGVELRNHDLSIQNEPIHEADKEAVGIAQSIAMERHKAVNWLMGWQELYSDVDTST